MCSLSRFPAQTSPRLAPFGRAVLSGLGRKPHVLPMSLFRDTRGRELFRALAYGPSAMASSWSSALAEAAGELTLQLDPEVALVELDADGHDLTSPLRTALLARQRWLRYCPMAESEADLIGAVERAAHRTPHLEIEPRRATLASAPALLARVPGARLVSLLGARIAECTPVELARLLGSVAAGLARPNQGMSSARDTVLLAFHTSASPSAACALFEQSHARPLVLYPLARLNRELGADFDLAAWTPTAAWNATTTSVEIGLLARQRQQVFIDALGIPLRFDAGDTIHVASVFHPDDDAIDRLLAAGSMVRRARWVSTQVKLVLAAPASVRPSR